MATAEDQELVERFEQFYRSYYHEEIGELAQGYPGEQRSLYLDWQDLYRFDQHLADDFLEKPEQLREYAEEALRLYDLPIDVKLGQAHVRVHNLPETTGIRDIRSRHVNTLVSVQGIVRKATSVRPKIQEAAFECQRCGTLTRIPQSGGDFQEPHECQGCERQGPFSINFDQSEFVDSQQLRIQESPEGLTGGETPESIDVHIEDDITGEVTPGDHVTVTGVLHLEQQGSNQEKSAVFDVYMDGVSVEIEDEEFEEMDITEEDKRRIVELSNEDDIYEQMVDSMAPSIYGYREEKLAIILQLFSGVTKHLPDGSRTRGDLHILLIGDPGTGKCLDGDELVTLSDGREEPIRGLVERNLDDPKPVDDGVYDEVDFEVPSLDADGSITHRRATKVWKREAPDEMYRIRTASGHEVEVTPSHPLFVSRPGDYEPVRADELAEGQYIATVPGSKTNGLAADGGHLSLRDSTVSTFSTLEVINDRIEQIETVEPSDDWVYDLEVEGTHNYISSNVVSHNSQLLQYVRNIAPRSVYTSGKGSSAAGLTAAAVRDDFGEGQQWSLEAGALVLADKGIAAVDELDKMRCVTGDTLVHTGDGRVIRMRELAAGAAEEGSIERLSNGRTIRDVDLTAWTMTDDGRLVERPVTAVHEYEAPDDLLAVTLASGETVTVTRDHPFIVFEDGDRIERPAAELEPGEWTYVPRQVPQSTADGGTASVSPPEPSAVSDRFDPVPALGAVLGYLSGDGNVFYDRDEGVYGIRFTNKEEQLLADFERSCRAAFGAEPTRPPSEQRPDGVETVRLHGREYADAVLDAGMNLETYDGKAFPDGVTAGPPATKAAFVRALADSEGHVDGQKLVVSSASRELLLGTKSLLLEFGVSSQIQHRPREDRRDVYKLAITDADSLARFARVVGFTLDRKQSALETAVEEASGDRTILDVIPECGDLLRRCRTQLRLHQSECGLDAVTYCDFERGRANVSLHRARRILSAFRARRSEAIDDLDVLDTPCSWDELESLRDRYHVSQAELAEETEYTQQAISRQWRGSGFLRETVRVRLSAIVDTVASADLSTFRTLVEGDVKWRQVESVEPATRSTDDRLRLLRGELADLLGCSPEHAVDRARAVLSDDPEMASWGGLEDELDRYGVSHAALADEVGVAQSTVTRWLDGTVETDRFDETRSAARTLVTRVRRRIRELLEEIERRGTSRVYDLTVEGTHNYLANGMVVHNSEDRSAMHEALEQQSYHPDSEILLADGRRVEIGDLVDERMDDNPESVVDGVDCEILPVDDLDVHTVDLDDNGVRKTGVDRVSRHEAPDEFVRVTFSNGRSVLVTPEHPMFVDDDGDLETVEASDVDQGDFVPAPRKLPNSSATVPLDDGKQVGREKDVSLPGGMSPDLAEMLGLLAAEGHSYAGSSHEIGFSNQDDRLLARADELMRSVFGMESTDTTSSDGTVTKRWVSTKLYRWFETNFPELMETAREKRIPAKVLGASEEEIRRFLVGTFAGDGGVERSSTARETESHGGVESEAMAFSTSSRGLADDYADALSKIGVASRIHHNSTEDSWKTYVMGDSTERFVEQVVEPADDRYEEARAFVERSNDAPRHHDVLPTSAAHEIRDLKRLLGERLTGRFKPNVDEGFGVQVETVESEVADLRERAGAVRERLARAEGIGEVRGAVDWSCRRLAERLDGETPSSIDYAESGGYDAERHEDVTDRARSTVEDALEEAERRLDALESRCDLRYYRVTDVETVPNEGEYETEWVYDVTVEPTNTFVSQGVVLHNSISISKAGINATLKSRCSLLGAANPEYGRFDQYEPIGEQIDLEPALISRFDLIFTVTDQPDEEEDKRLAEHIIQTNYAGELNTHREEMAASNVSEEQVENVTESVAPTIDADLLRKYVAYAKRDCFPTMTEKAKEAIRDFYVDLRAKGQDEDAPVPVTARKLEALVRLAEASARMRLSDTVEEEDAERVIEIVRSCLQDIGVDPETGQFDADVVETGTSKTQRDRIKNVKQLIADIEEEYEEGAPVEKVVERADEVGLEPSKVEHEIESLKQKGELYEPSTDHLRTT